MSEVGFGAWAIGGNARGNSYGPTDDRESLAAVRRALELGCNFFDTADVYGHGHSETILGTALRESREDVVIATKVGGDFYGGVVRTNFFPDYIEFALEMSLERLRTSYIDVYQLHNPSILMIKEGSVFRTLDQLKKKGKIRFTGISIHDPKEGIEAIRMGRPDAIQVVYNIMFQEASEELFSLARSEGVAIIAREPLANGFLTGKYRENSTFPVGDIRHYWSRSYVAGRTQAARKLKFLERNNRTLTQSALRFVLANDAVSVTIPGAKTPKHVEENLAASDAEPLTRDELDKIRELHVNKFYLS